MYHGYCMLYEKLLPLACLNQLLTNFTGNSCTKRGNAKSLHLHLPHTIHGVRNLQCIPPHICLSFVFFQEIIKILLKLFSFFNVTLSKEGRKDCSSWLWFVFL